MLQLADELVTLPDEFLAYLDEMAEVWNERVICSTPVVGWPLDGLPAGVDTPAPIDHIVLTNRQIYWRGPSRWDNYASLLWLIRHIRFDRAPRGARSVAPNIGLAQVFTPSGRSLFLCTQQVAAMLPTQVREAKAWARSQGVDREPNVKGADVSLVNVALGGR